MSLSDSLTFRIQARAYPRDRERVNQGLRVQVQVQAVLFGLAPSRLTRLLASVRVYEPTTHQPLKTRMSIPADTSTFVQTHIHVHEFTYATPWCTYSLGSRCMHTHVVHTGNWQATCPERRINSQAGVRKQMEPSTRVVFQLVKF